RVVAVLPISAIWLSPFHKPHLATFRLPVQTVAVKALTAVPLTPSKAAYLPSRNSPNDARKLAQASCLTKYQNLIGKKTLPLKNSLNGVNLSHSGSVVGGQALLRCSSFFAS